MSGFFLFVYKSKFRSILLGAVPSYQFGLAGVSFVSGVSYCMVGSLVYGHHYKLSLKTLTENLKIQAEQSIFISS